MEMFNIVVHLTDAAVPGLLAARQTDPRHRDYNGILSPGKGFGEPFACASAAATWIAAYLCPASVYYKNEDVLSAAEGALTSLISRCHEDGTLDLMETNFHDATCNAFAVQLLAYTYRLLTRDAVTNAEQTVALLVRDFLQTSAKAMLNGGFHTPNHRWVLASALSLCANTLGDIRCSELAKVYLSEDVDQNEDGDYTERSAGVYDPVCNESFCILAEEMGLPALYEHVRRNLEKLMYYLEPDGTVLTMASRRQDYGKNIIPVRNFLPALLLYRRTGCETALALATELFRGMDTLELKSGPPAQRLGTLHHPTLLTHFLLNPALAAALPDGPGLPLKYNKYFVGAGVARYRHGHCTLTLVRDNPVFLKLQNGHLKMYLRVAASFFGRGKLCAQTIKPIDGGYRCRYEAEKGYYRPIGNLHQKEWENIDHTKRETVLLQHLCFEADVFAIGNTITLRIRSDGTADVPFKVEFVFEPDGIMRTVGTTQPGLPGGYTIAGEPFTYERFGEILRIEGGFHQHEYIDMRGSEPMPPNSYCVFFTGFTPIDYEITITAGSASSSI